MEERSGTRAPLHRSIHVALFVALISAACTQAPEPLVEEDARPTSTALPPEAQSAVCDAAASVREFAEDLGTEGLEGTGELVSELEDLRSDLEERASELEAEAPEAGAAVRTLVESLTRLRDAVEAADAAEIATASADVAGAAADVPGCPTPAS